MASKNHEELASIMVRKAMEARNFEEYANNMKSLCPIRNAYKYATERSRLECDLKRFIKDKPWFSYEDDIEETIQDLSKKIGKQVHFRTKPLWECLERKFIEELQKNQDQWQTAKIIYSLAWLYDDDDEKISNAVYSIKDDLQRRSAVICARVYFDGYEKVFEIFSPASKI